MPGRRLLRRVMQDLTGLNERRNTFILAILLVAILLVPAIPGAAQVGRADAPPAVPSTTPTPTPTPTPTDDPSSEEVLGGVIDRLDDLGGSEAPEPTTAPSEPTDVEAEGEEPEEVVAPTPPSQEPAPAEGEVVAQGDEPVPAVEPTVPAEGEAAADGEVPALTPPPIETYGVSVVPSLGTAQRPLSDPLSGDPMVLAPMVAGQDVKPESPAVAGTAAPEKSALLEAAEPVQNVAAASLSVIQPSWFATTMAMLVLLGAAAYGAVLRRRGERVPEALAFGRPVGGAVRPSDQSRMARSVRPADLRGAARSIRP